MTRPIYPLVLVACGKRKLDAAAPAKNLYISPRFEKAREFAETYGARWLVLSAKHGAICPEKVIEPYDIDLSSLPPDRKRAWADAVLQTIRNSAEDASPIVVLATNSYSASLRETFERSSLNAIYPLSDLPEDYMPSFLERVNSNPERLADYLKFYSLLNRLQEGRDSIPFSKVQGKQFAKAGVYFFSDKVEMTRFNFTVANRLVRIGTHGVSKGSKSLLWQRLRTHRGNDDGTGSHRSSIFRLHVGKAMLALQREENATWGQGSTAGKDIRDAEELIESKVSAYLGDLTVTHLPILDAASADSDRSYIEMNSISLLTGGGALDVPSPHWLGNSSPTAQIRESGLWNVNYVGELYDRDFLSVFEELIARHESGRLSSESLAPCNWRTRLQSGALGQNELFEEK
jgi:IS5 family transposase